MAHPSGRWVSSSTGEPQRVSPTSAPRRAISVASVSGDGTARSSSEYWTMRAGRGIDLDRHHVDRRGRGMGFQIEQQQRAQDARIAHRRRQLQQPRVRRPIGQPQRQMHRDRAAVRLLERGRQRIEQPGEHERQRLERVDRPFQLARSDEAHAPRDRE